MGLFRSDLRAGTIVVVGDVRILIEHKSGRLCRLAIEHPGDHQVEVIPAPETKVGQLAEVLAQ